MMTIGDGNVVASIVQQGTGEQMVVGCRFEILIFESPRATDDGDAVASLVQQGTGEHMAVGCRW